MCISPNQNESNDMSSLTRFETQKPGTDRSTYLLSLLLKLFCTRHVLFYNRRAHKKYTLYSSNEILATSQSSSFCIMKEDPGVGDKNHHHVAFSTQILENDAGSGVARVTEKCQASTEEDRNIKQTSFLETLSHMLNGSIGCGILGMGMAFKHGGLVFSSFLVIIVAFIAVYNQHLLVMLAEKCKHKYNFHSVTIMDAVCFVFDEGSALHRKFSNIIRKTISVLLFTNQLGCCCAYLLFLSETSQHLLNTYEIHLRFHIIMIFVTFAVWATALVRHLKHIAPISTLANAATFLSLGIILYTSIKGLPPITERKLIGSWDKLPLSFGLTIFAMEGISLTLSVQQNMRNKPRYVSTFGVLNLTIMIVTVLTSAVGIFGYWKYGDRVGNTLTLNLVLRGNILSQIVIINMIIGILCTYALQLFVPVQLLLPIVNRKTAEWIFHKHSFYEYLLRSALVLLTFFFAAVIPYFDLITSLLGAVAGSFIGFIFCPLADLISRDKNDRGRFGWRQILAVISIIIGLIAFFIGTVTSLKEIVLAIKRDLITG